MKSSRLLFLLFTSFILQVANGQLRGKKSEGIYFIDSTIKKEVEEKVKLDEGRIKGMQFLKVYKNDSIVIDSYAWQTPFETQILSRLKRDTVYIASNTVSFTNLGFSIAIFRDSCQFYVEESSALSSYYFKLNKKSPLTHTLFITPSSFKLTLVDKPLFNENEVIQGIIEMTSDDYYEITHDGEKSKKVQLTSYFKTKPLTSKISLPK